MANGRNDHVTVFTLYLPCAVFRFVVELNSFALFSPIPKALANFCFLHIVLNRTKIILYEKASPIGNLSISRCAECMYSNNSRHRP